jgi:hypothetical protein
LVTQKMASSTFCLRAVFHQTKYFFFTRFSLIQVFVIFCAVSLQQIKPRNAELMYVKSCTYVHIS